MAKKAIMARSVTGMEEMKMLATQMNAAKNDMFRSGGFTPSQWVLGKIPRRRAGEQCDEDGYFDIGSIQERANGSMHFARSMRMREACREAFIKTDCSRRVVRVPSQPQCNHESDGRETAAGCREGCKEGKGREGTDCRR